MNEDALVVFEMVKHYNSRKYWIRVPFKHWLIAKMQFKESRLKFRNPKRSQWFHQNHHGGGSQPD